MVCDKQPRTANRVSHAKNRTGRWLYPNVQKIRFKLTNNNENKVYRGAVCTKCIKARKIEKII